MADDDEVDRHVRSGRPKVVLSSLVFVWFAVYDIGVHWYRQGGLGRDYWLGKGGLRVAICAAVVVWGLSALRITPETRQRISERLHRTRSCPKCGRDAARTDTVCGGCGAAIEPIQRGWIVFGIVLVFAVDVLWRLLQ
jgi:hypothetical protein